MLFMIKLPEPCIQCLAKDLTEICWFALLFFTIYGFFHQDIPILSTPQGTHLSFTSAFNQHRETKKYCFLLCSKTSFSPGCIQADQ